MSLLKLVFYFYFTWGNEPKPIVIEEVEIPQADLDLEMALPGPDQAEVKLRKVEVVLDLDGKVNAVSGDDQLDAFDATQPEKMKPLRDWLAKLGKKDKLSVMVRVHGGAKMEGVTNLLNVLATQGITEISFSDLANKK